MAWDNSQEKEKGKGYQTKVACVSNGEANDCAVQDVTEDIKHVTDELQNLQKERELEKQELDNKIAERVALEKEQLSIKNRPPQGSRSSIILTKKPIITDNSAAGKIALLQWHALKILSNQRFDAGIGMVILINSITIGIVSSLEVKNMYGSPEEKTDITVFENLEHVFLVIYSMELLMRFFAMGLSCLRSHWVKFDFILVCLSGLSSWVIEPIMVASQSDGSMEALAPLMVLRVMRLLRLARSVRLLVQFKTLWMLVSGLLSSAGTMFYTFALMLLILYVFACLGVELITKDENLYRDPEVGGVVQQYFSSVTVVMLTLVQFITMDSIGSIYTPLVHKEPLLILYFMIFLVLVSISLMNLVTAVLTQSAIEQRKLDTEVQKAYENQRIMKLIPHFKQLFHDMDEDGNGTLSLDEVLNAPDEVKQELQKIMQTDQLLLLFELLDTDQSGEISVDEFCDGLTRMITSEEPIEFIRLRKQIQQIRIDQADLRSLVKGIDGKLDRLITGLPNHMKLPPEPPIEPHTAKSM